mmetsp:Transcript_2283/g.5432  ORF Transcript_2283/g.5432 Transcript_2283/m.5432 type:complete len:211 (+) Transcript_2283:1688-2320(+)
MRLTGAGGALDERHALEQRRLERVSLRLVHVRHRLQVHGLVDHALALHGMELLVLFRRTHVRNGRVVGFVAVPPGDEDVADGRVHAGLLAGALAHLHHVLQRVELAQEGGAVGKLVDAPPAAAHRRCLLRVASDELHGHLRHHRRDFSLELIVGAPPPATLPPALPGRRSGSIPTRPRRHLDLPARALGHVAHDVAAVEALGLARRLARA